MFQSAGLGRLVALIGIPWATVVLLALANIVYDAATTRRVHWASVCGAALVLVPTLVFRFGGALGRIPIAQDVATFLLR